MTEHEAFIKQTYELARQAVAQGNHPFGVLLVKDGEQEGLDIYRRYWQQ